MNQSFHCEHSKTYARLTVDGGLNETLSIDLCYSCYLEKKYKFIINEEILN